MELKNIPTPTIPDWLKLYNTYDPAYYTPGKRVSAEEWNTLFLASVKQGNYNADTLELLIKTYLPETYLTKTDFNMFSAQMQDEYSTFTETTQEQYSDFTTQVQQDFTELTEEVNSLEARIIKAEDVAYALDDTIQEANSYAKQANITSEKANTIAQNADNTSAVAVNIANNAVSTANEALSRVIEEHGTQVLVNGESVKTFDADTKADAALLEFYAKLDAPSNTFTGDLNIEGNIYQKGDNYITHAEHVYSKNNYIVLRAGAENSLGSDSAGFLIKKYNGANDGRLVMDSSGVARVGDIGDEQPLATREEAPINDGFAKWNTSKFRFETVKLSEEANAFAEAERQKSKNLFDGKLLAGKAYASDTGNQVNASKYVCSENKLSVEPNSPLHLTFDTDLTIVIKNSGFVFYNNDSFVGAIDGVLSAKVPSNANRVAFSINTVESGDLVDHFSNIALISYGAIVHKNDAPVLFAEAERQKSKNLFNSKYELGFYDISSGQPTDSSSYKRTVTKMPIKPNTQYTFSTSISNPAQILLFYDASLNYISYQGMSGYTTYPFTTPSNAYYFTYYTQASVEADIQIEEGPVATDYQPYNGPITHDNDAPIVFVENEIQKSKNLFNINAPFFWAVGHTFVNGNTITVEAGGSTEADTVFGLIPVKENTTYYIGANASHKRLLFRIYDENKNVITSAIPNWVYNQYWKGSYADFPSTEIRTQLTIPSGAKYLAFCTAWLGSEQTFSNVIISEYSDIDNYQPYNGPITHNNDTPVVFAESERQKSKNLFTILPLTYTSAGITYTANTDTQTIKISGTTEVSYVRIPASGRAVLEAGKPYTISGHFTSTEGIATYLHFTDDTFQTLIVQNKTGAVVYVPPTQKVINAIAIEMYSKTFNDDVLQIQVESGTAATEWQYPYGALLHEKDVANRTLVYDVLYNQVDIYNSTLTTLKEYFDLFSIDPSKIYNCGIGYMHTSNFKNLVGTPPGGANYTNASIRLCANGYSYGDFRTFEVLAVDPAANCVAIGYIYGQWDQKVVFTGWTRIGQTPTVVHTRTFSTLNDAFWHMSNEGIAYTNVLRLDVTVANNIGNTRQVCTIKSTGTTFETQSNSRVMNARTYTLRYSAPENGWTCYVSSVADPNSLDYYVITVGRYSDTGNYVFKFRTKTQYQSASSLIFSQTPLGTEVLLEATQDGTGHVSGVTLVYVK